MQLDLIICICAREILVNINLRFYLPDSSSMRLGLLVTLILVVVSISEAKKKKKSKKPAPLFDTKSLNCLVCKSLVEEIEALIHKVGCSHVIGVVTLI